MTADPSSAPTDFDVIIVGGALSGSATALQILQQRPDARVAIVEKSGAFGRRVGEATIEVSTYFLLRVLGLTRHLNEHHLAKQGLRFWFANENTRNLGDCSELGGSYLVRLPSYQLDRAVLDAEVLRRAVAAGATLFRPANVRRIELREGGSQRVFATVDGEEREWTARWLVDASGLAALLARQEGWWRRNTAHPTAAAWSRWRSVGDWDDLRLAERYPRLMKGMHGLRGTATNHLMGDGWWAWWIPLKGGDVSIGIVLDQRRVSLPAGDNLAGRIKSFLLERHPVARELMAEAECVEGDAHWRRHLAYRSERFAGDGFMLVGDAAAFIDPFYSPGLDFLAYSSATAADLVIRQLAGEPVAERAAAVDARFGRSYDRWFEAIYLNKYDYLGEFDLTRVAFLLDLGLYYFGIVSQPYRRGKIALLEPYYSTAPSVPFYHLMRTYNRRLAAMGRSRRERGVSGRTNAGRRFLFPGFSFAPPGAIHLVKALLAWGALELSEGWRTWFSKRPAPGETDFGQAESAKMVATEGRQELTRR